MGKPCGHEDTRPGCNVCRLAATEPAYARLWAQPAPPTARRGLCLHLGPREEFRPGCGGWTCRHGCDRGHAPAVPGGSCQTCEDYEPS